MNCSYTGEFRRSLLMAGCRSRVATSRCRDRITTPGNGRCTGSSSWSRRYTGYGFAGISGSHGLKIRSTGVSGTACVAVAVRWPAAGSAGGVPLTRASVVGGGGAARRLELVGRPFVPGGHGVGRRLVRGGRFAPFGQDRADLVVGEAPELAPAPGAVQDGDFQVLGGDGPLAAVPQGPHRRPDAASQIPVLPVVVPEVLGELLGQPPDAHVALLVGDAPVEQHVEDLVLLRTVPHLRHQDLHLVGFHLLGEDGRQGLRVRVRQGLRADVLAPVGVAPDETLRGG